MLNVQFNIEFTTVTDTYYIAIYVAQRVDIILGRTSFTVLQDLHFILLYVVVSQRIDKHLYLTSCLNACNHNTFAPKQGVLRERWHSSLLVKIAKHKY